MTYGWGTVTEVPAEENCHFIVQFIGKNNVVIHRHYRKDGSLRNDNNLPSVFWEPWELQ